ncbi:MAG: hypothetical protein A2293_05420 [Elusimicrobia bacterium RIFOXYB2_FULL_49_7]|nr:MAG: hypothetical protein A2293_05420 [Elusimicrobia bacterium RIFOXYB2_FULL_49_7]
MPNKNSRIVILQICVMMITTNCWSLEKLICGFEKEELTLWPGLNLVDSSGTDYGYNGAQAIGFVIRKDSNEATEGSYHFIHEVYPAAPTAGFLSTRRYASWYQDWSMLQNYWDSSRVPVGEYGGPADWQSTRFANLYNMYKILTLMDSLKKWSGYKWLCIDAKISEESATLRVNVEDRWKQSNYRHYLLTPGGWKTLCFPLADIVRVQDLDLSEIINLRILLCRTTGPCVIEFDNIRLLDTLGNISDPLVYDNSPLFPWIIGSGWWGNSPLKSAPPPVYVPQERITGSINKFITNRIATGRNTYNSVSSYEHPEGVIPFDDNRMLIARSMVVQSNPSQPIQSNPRATMQTVDGGHTWSNLAGEINGFPTIIDKYCAWSATPKWMSGDNLLRGNGYVMEMEWCSTRGDNAGIPLFWHFYKIAMTGPNSWQIFPATPPETSDPQKPERVIAGFTPHTCEVRGPAIIALPNGELWSVSGTWTAYKKNYTYYECSFSLDGGLHWQHVNDKPYIANGTNPRGFSGGQLMPLAYENKFSLAVYTQNYLELHQSDGKTWTTKGIIGWPGWSKLVNAISYHNDRIFFLVGDLVAPKRLILTSYKDGHYAAADSVCVAGNISGYRMTLCGQTVWLFWIDSDDGAVKYRVYDIPSETWLTGIMEAVKDNDFPIGYLHVPQTSPPSHVPLTYVLSGPIPTGYSKESDYYNSQEFPKDPDPWAIKTVYIPIPPEQAVLDSDYDGLNNTEENRLGTSNSNPDSDGDHLLDGQEVNLLGTNPLFMDTDNDGDNDDVELYYYTDPLKSNRSATRNTSPSASLTADIVQGQAPLTVCFDASLSSDANEDGLCFKWDLDHVIPHWVYGYLKNDNNVLDGGNKMVYTFNEGGNYQVKVTAYDGRGGQDTKEITITVDGVNAEGGTNLIKNRNIINCFPNPVTANRVKFSVSALALSSRDRQDASVGIYSISGKLLKKWEINSTLNTQESFVWHTKNTASGIYIIKLTTRSKTFTKRVLVSK